MEDGENLGLNSRCVSLTLLTVSKESGNGEMNSKIIKNWI